ncbi:MAG: Hsp20/alpha crystallin family protein [Puniceicoccaceae bacterium]|nr:MAG: Hsp20/alpha crystallin family protein [Puniceicoccaceae bacterium]
MSTELETIQTPENKPLARDWQRPHYTVSESAEVFHVKVSLPGVNREGIDISLEKDTLTVVGTRSQNVPDTWRPLRRELSTADYRLSLRLNVPVNESEIKAQIEDGILDLSLPKADEVKPRKIQIA